MVNKTHWEACSRGVLVGAALVVAGVSLGACSSPTTTTTTTRTVTSETQAVPVVPQQETTTVERHTTSP